MQTQTLLDPKRWAERTFGGVRLHDLRRTRRAVQAATRLAENPLGSLPAQMQTWKATKALYRWLGEEDVTFAAVMQPHLELWSAQGAAAPVSLLGQDTTDSDLSHRHQISGVGQIGNERGRGFFLQTVLAVRPATGEVLGCIAQAPFVRIPAPKGEGRADRHKRAERETDVWMRQVQAIGTPDPGCTAPSGKAGSRCNRLLRAFALLLSSVCKMWVRIRLLSPGMHGLDNKSSICDTAS